MQGIEQLVGGAIELALGAKEAVDPSQCCLLIQAYGFSIGAEVLACHIQQGFALAGGGHLHPDAAAMEGRRKITLAVGGHHHDREGLALHPPRPDGSAAAGVIRVDLGQSTVDKLTVRLAGFAAQLRNLIRPLLKQMQQLIGQLQIRLVDLIDQQHPRGGKWQKGGAQGPEGDEVSRRYSAAALRIAQAIERLVAIQPFAHFAAGGDRPAQHPPEAQLMGNGIGQAGFAATGRAGDQ